MKCNDACFALLVHTLTDERNVMGYFVVTGSSQFELIASINQSLAGRVGRVEVLSLSLSELQNANKLPTSLNRMSL